MPGTLSTMLGVAVWVCMLGGWTIDLAGVGRYTNLCMDASSTDLGDKNCGFETSFLWWTLALQFLCVVLALVSIFTNSLNRGLVTALVAISIVQLSITARDATTIYRQQHNSKVLDTDLGMANSAILAGKIIELVFNYVWLFMFAKFVHVDGASLSASADAGNKPTSA